MKLSIRWPTCGNTTLAPPWPLPFTFTFTFPYPAPPSPGECDLNHTRQDFLKISSLLNATRCGLRVARGALVAHRYTMLLLAAEPRSIAGLLLPSQCNFWTILLTPYSMVWFQEQGQCFLIDLSCSVPTIVFYYFFLSLLSGYRMVLWGWGLLTDRVYLTLSQPFTADLF